MFEDVQPLDLMGFIHPEEFERHEEAEDEDAADSVPQGEGSAGQSVPGEHHDGCLAATKQQSSLHEEWSGQDPPEARAEVDRNSVQGVVNLYRRVRTLDLNLVSPSSR